LLIKHIIAASGTDLFLIFQKPVATYHISMAEDEVEPKRLKTESGTCIICGGKSPLYDLSSPRDEESWKTLCQAAEIQHFQPIIHTAENSETNFSNIKYHRDCRSNFTHKKKLLIVKKQEYINEQDSLRTRHSTRQASSTQSRVYDTICIFCQSKSKYIKGTNSREPLKPAVELRADKTIRDIATELQDDRILSITARDIVAAEAHYHKTCYRNYTRGQTERISSECSGADNPYQKQERAAFNKVCEYIRTDVFSNPRIVALSDLTAKVVCFMESNGFEVTEATKNHMRRNLYAEFGDPLHFFTVARRVYCI